MKKDEQLVLIVFDIKIPNHWENNLVKKFPEASFTIHGGHPVSKKIFCGILKIENVDFLSIQEFLNHNHPKTILEDFSPESNLFHYSDLDFPLAKIFGEIKGILSWPVKFEENFKRIKIILKDREVSDLMDFIEEKFEILTFSKIRIVFKPHEILTTRQKEIFEPSLKLGYYEFPKKINLNELSGKIGISPSTLCVHLQKIESKLLNLNHSELFFRGLQI